MPNIKIDNEALAFIFDWKMRADKQQRKYTILSVAVFTVAFLFCITAFFMFQRENYERIVRQNSNFIQDSAIQETDEIERLLDSGITTISVLAFRYAILEKYNIGDSAAERLQTLMQNTLFDDILFVDANGCLTDDSGNNRYIADDEIFYQAGMQGESGHEAPSAKNVIGDSHMIFYAPVILDDEIIGVMVGTYDRERLNSLFTYKLFGYAPRTYLLKRDGTIIANSGKDELSGNILEQLSQKTFIGDTDYEKIKEVIADPERTVVTFNFGENRRDTSVGVIVQFVQNDWLLLSVLPQDVTGNMISRVNKASIQLLCLIAFAFCLTITILLIFLWNQKKQMNREVSLAADNLSKAIQRYREQFSIIESLAEAYTGVNRIDLQTFEYTRIKEEAPRVRNVIAESGDFIFFASIYIKEFVDEKYVPDMEAFMDAKTLSERIEQNGVLSMEFQRIDKAWKRVYFIPSERDENGHIISVLFVAQPIDKEKEKELAAKEALQDAYEAARIANSAKTTFLSNMSHDIRTPMNAIIGMTAIAASHINEPEKVSECLRKITSSSKHLLGLINDVLDMSKIESGKVDLSEDEFNLSELMDNLITIHQPLIAQKEHTLMVRVNNLTHEKVIGDSTRLQQIFANMLSNAIKYTPSGGKLEIDITEKDTNSPSVGLYEVSFKDNGIGMSEEYQKKLFEPFSRSDDDRVSNIQGTGLGMAIANNVAHMMNGEIRVESHINEGSTFTVSFSLKLQSEEDIDYASFVDLPVLVVDDDKEACEVTCTMLDSLAMNSEWVTSGYEAIEKVIEHHNNNNDYYAVIIDWKMPGMDGLETTREIRKQIGHEIPIIVISAYDWSDIEQDAKDAGVDMFVSKPLFKSKLVNLFSEILNGKHDAADQNSDASVSQHDFSGSRILLVEDNDINREVAVELLSITGLEIDAAENGKICVDKFNSSEPGYYDLIFMDVQMPVMDGYEATKAIREMDRPDARTIPIYAMTANAFSSDVQDAMNAGMNGHIAKPIDIRYVMKVLESTLS